jgi:hypothetical protein
MKGRSAIVLLAAAAAAACTALGSGGGTSARKLSWVSYLNGEDLRGSCRPGQPEHYRLIYNAEGNQQLRAIEVSGEGNGATVETRVFTASNAIEIDFKDPLALGRGQLSVTHISQAELDRLTRMLDDTGMFGPSRGGLTLNFPSDGYYWLATGCHDGAYFLNAIALPSDRFEGTAFLGTRALGGAPWQPAAPSQA